MSNAREHKGRFGRLMNRPKPLQLFSFLKARVLRLRHGHRKPVPDGLVIPPTLVQDAAEDSSWVVNDIQRTLDQNSTFIYNHGVKNENQGSALVSKSAASQHVSSQNHLQLLNLAGIKPTSIEGCISVASPKDGPFLRFELVFGADFPRDKTYCYRARAPMVYGLSSTPHNEFRREPTQRAGRLWLPEEEPLKKQEEPEPPKPEPPKRLACPYLIYDPATYESHQGCRGAAFPDTSRLKEHLYRSHKQQPHCAKCGEPFADESSQEKHGLCSSSLTRSVTGNRLREFKGFDKKQEAKLRDKKRKRGESNQEKWKDIFKILFPDATEIPSPYYKSPARKEFQDGAAESRNVINYSFINNLFNNHVADSMARSQVEKMQGPMPEEDWRKMKEIFRGFVLSDLKKPREDQTSVCGSSTSSASHQAPGAKRNVRSSQKENFDPGDISSTILNIDRQTEAPANSREPDLAHVLPSIDIDDWLASVGGMFGDSNRPRPPHRPNQASTNSKPQTARLPSQPSQPSQLVSPNLPSTPSLSNTSAYEATSGPKSSLSTKQAPEDGLDPHQEATAEICEERVFNNLNLTPEEYLAAALQQNTLIWQQPEDKSTEIWETVNRWTGS